MNNISFQANININYSQLKQDLAKDKFLVKNGSDNIRTLLKNIENLSSMKENATVSIEPRINNSQLNLITFVESSNKLIKSMINKRYARKMESDESFAMRYFNNIKKTIENIEIAIVESDKVKKAINNMHTIIDDNFLSQIPKHIFNSLQKGYTPTERIIEILNNINKSKTNKKNIISIKQDKKQSIYPKTSKVITYFYNNDDRITIDKLLKDPASKLWK